MKASVLYIAHLPPDDGSYIFYPIDFINSILAQQHERLIIVPIVENAGNMETRLAQVHETKVVSPSKTLPPFPA